MENVDKYCKELYIYLVEQSEFFKENSKFLHLGRDEEELFGHDRPYALAFMHNALVADQKGDIPSCMFFAVLLRMSGARFVPSEQWGMKIEPVLGLGNGGFETEEEYKTFMSCFTDYYGSQWLLDTLKSISTI